MLELTADQARDIVAFAGLLISYGYSRIVAQAAIFLIKRGETV